MLRNIDHGVKKDVENVMVDKAYQVFNEHHQINQEGETIKHKIDKEQSRERHGGTIKDFFKGVDTKHYG